MKNKRHSLYMSFLVMTLIPIIGYSLIMMIFSAKHIEELMHNQIQEEMKKITYTVINVYDEKYPGKFTYDTKEKILKKGQKDISLDYSIIDDVKETFSMDVSIIYGNVRCITTLKDVRGLRLNGSLVKQRVLNDINEEKTDVFYDNIEVSKEKYLSYYSPIMDEDGNVIGMVAALKSAEEVDAAIIKAILPICLLSICIMVIAGAISIGFSKAVVDNIRRVESFMVKITGGNLTCRQPDSDLKRNNELGEMARTAAAMQDALRNLVEIDELTGILNRKAGSARVRKAFTKLGERDSVITVALGDIDFFKKVNDTYGHETGDVVLRHVAQTIKKYSEGKGVPIRWGGEEFLILFENMNKAEAIETLEKIRKKIKEKTFAYEGAEFTVTMTFGAKQADKSMSYSEAIAQADELLYKGKAEGRDRVM